MREAVAEEAGPEIVGPGPTTVALRVNGVTQAISIEPRMTLAEALRGPLGLTGAKIGCDRGACSARTVLLDPIVWLGVPSATANTSPAKRKSGKVIEQALGKHVQRPQIGDVVGAEAEACELVEKIVEATGEEEVAAFRQLADEEAERRGLAHAAGPIGAQHGEFIEIGEQTVAPGSRLR